MAFALTPEVKKFAGITLVNYLLRLSISVCLALPFARLSGASGLEQFPAGDRLLFEASGVYLLELVRVSGPELTAQLQSSGRLLLVVALVLLVARALTFAALHEPRAELGRVCQRARALVPSYLLIAGLTLLLQVLALGAVLWAGLQLSDALGRGSELRGDVTLGACVALGLLAAVLLSAVAELARACLVHEQTSAMAALGRAFGLLRAIPGRVLAAYGVPTASGAVLVVLAAALTQYVDVSRDSAGRAWAVFGLHQLVALALVALHTLWLQRALRLASPGLSA